MALIPSESGQKKFWSYSELKAEVERKMGEGDNIKKCDLVNRALEIINVRLLRSPGLPANAFDEVSELDNKIRSDHAEFCPNQNNH